MILKYNAKPDPIFQVGKGEKIPKWAQYYDTREGRRVWPDATQTPDIPFYGIEIEYEYQGGEATADDKTWEMMPSISANGFYVKRDGSLKNGLELVSHPFSWKHWQEKEKSIHNMLRQMRDIGLRSYKGGRCAIHVHVGLQSFKNIAHIYKWMYLWLSNRQFLRAVSKRIPRTFNQYAYVPKNPANTFRSLMGAIHKIYFNISQEKVRDLQQTYVHALQGMMEQVENAHHLAIAFTPKTLEIRIWRGTLNTARIYGILETIEASREYTRNLMNIRPTPEDFLRWIIQQPGYERAKTKVLNKYLIGKNKLNEEKIKKLVSVQYKPVAGTTKQRGLVAAIVGLRNKALTFGKKLKEKVDSIYKYLIDEQIEVWKNEGYNPFASKTDTRLVVEKARLINKAWVKFATPGPLLPNHLEDIQTHWNIQEPTTQATIRWYNQEVQGADMSSCLSETFSFGRGFPISKLFKNEDRDHGIWVNAAFRNYPILYQLTVNRVRFQHRNNNEDILSPANNYRDIKGLGLFPFYVGMMSSDYPLILEPEGWARIPHRPKLVNSNGQDKIDFIDRYCSFLDEFADKWYEKEVRGEIHFNGVNSSPCRKGQAPTFAYKFLTNSNAMYELEAEVAKSMMLQEKLMYFVKDYMTRSREYLVGENELWGCTPELTFARGYSVIQNNQTALAYYVILSSLVHLVDCAILCKRNNLEQSGFCGLGAGNELIGLPHPDYEFLRVWLLYINMSHKTLSSAIEALASIYDTRLPRNYNKPWNNREEE